MAKEPFDLYPPFQINRKIHFNQSEFSIPVSALPKQYINGDIRLSTGEKRCKIDYGKQIMHGGYGNITMAKRTEGVAHYMCVKCPRDAQASLSSEAIVQWLAANTLERLDILGAVPHVYDIFQYAGETRFSMEFIRGVSSVQKIVEAEHADVVFLQILAQASLILAVLEEHLRLDHRDLKADNLWIRDKPVDYRITVGGVTWQIAAPFQVVILDFGFSCIGDVTGNSVISLSDGILPRIDPCPKEGRDVFQLIASLWSVPNVRERMNPTITKEIEALLSYKNKSYAPVAKQIQSHWIYLVVSDPAFRHPPLHPISLLRILQTTGYVA